MNDDDTSAARAPRASHELRLPGFVPEQSVGLGDVVKRATSAVGIKPCGPCAQRAVRMNGWLVFSGRR